MNVTFAAVDPSVASTRLRGTIPQAVLAELGIPRGLDVLIIGKHGWSFDQIKGYRKIVFDVCDDHFDGIHRAHYHEAFNRADAVTCSTPGLREIIKARTGRDAIVIADPYEQVECAPRVHESLLWFGHQSNLPDLKRALPELAGHPLRVVTNQPGDGGCMVQWSPEVMDREFNRAGLVIIPTGAKKAKSANRAVEAIRRGLYVVAEPLPAYAELGIWQGNLRDGIDWALAHQDVVLRRISAAQDYVRTKYAPSVIAQQWLRVLEGLNGKAALPKR